MKTKTDKAVAYVITKLRKRVGYTQTDLAKKLGVSQTQVQKYEAAINRLSYSRALEYCHALGVEFDAFNRMVELEVSGGL